MTLARSLLIGMLSVLPWVVGCGGQSRNDLSMIPNGPLTASDTERLAMRLSSAPANKEAAVRVSNLGNRILQANGFVERGSMPVFSTIGAPQLAVFNKGSEIYITEGLVSKCKTDGQLAAVLAVAIGRMISEREALAGPAVRAPEIRPPIEVSIGRDSGGAFGPPDGTRLMELAKYEKEKKRREKLNAPPDPSLLAEQYLLRAGYSKGELTQVQPLLREAHKHATLEKQIKRTSSAIPGR